MAGSSSIRDLLTGWGVKSEWIKNFEDQEISIEGLLSLTKQDICDLIPKIGPRNAFIERLQTLLKQQTRKNKRCNKKNNQVATSSSASINTACKSFLGNVKEPPQRATVNTIRCQPPNKSKAKRTIVDKGSFPQIPISLFEDTNHDLHQPSTSMGDSSPGKRKREGDDVNKQKKNQKRTTEIFGQLTLSDDQRKREVKTIMGNLKSKLENMTPAKLTDFLSDKLETLENDKKKMVGVFGRTGAGKSSLLNAVLGETQLLPSGYQGACTSVMIQLEANMNDNKYIAEIEFLKVQEWEDELSSFIKCKSCLVGDDEDMGDDEIITAFYGKDGLEKDFEELMDKKHFKKIPEFLFFLKKEITCDTAEELSKEISCFTRSDPQNDTFKAQFWPLVKCITIKVPNSKELLEHVVLVDLPGNGDCNKSRDEIWKKFVGNCCDVWIVSDISRATSEKECWDILDSTVSLFGHGGECQRICFICTKTDLIHGDQTADARTSILSRNKTTKKQVRDKFTKHQEIKKHFSDVNDIFEVFTVSSIKYDTRTHLEEDETEIPHLQKILRNLNDHRTRTSEYISEAYGILSLIQGAKNRNMTDSKKEVCQFLEERLKDNHESIGECLKESYEAFRKSLTKGVLESEDSIEKLMDKVIAPRGKHHGGHHKILKSLCQNDGVYKPKRKKNRGKEINLNESLASCMRSCIDEEFKIFFPNDKHGPIRKQIDKFTIDATSLMEKYPSMSLYLTFLESEERVLKEKLICELHKKKKKLYFTLSDSIKETMKPCYRRASEHNGKECLKRMKDELRQHVNNVNIFQKAKDDMLTFLTKLKEDIMMQLKFHQEQSIEISLKTPDILILPDVTEDYNKIKEFMDCSAPSTLTASADVQSMSGNGNKHAQTVKKTSAFIDLDPPNMQYKPKLLDSMCNNLRVSENLIPTDAQTERDNLCDAFVKKNRHDLIQRVTMVESIADMLLQHDMIQDEMYSKISKGPTPQKQMRILLGAVQAAGKKTISTFYKALRTYEMPLLMDLASNQDLIQLRASSGLDPQLLVE